MSVAVELDNVSKVFGSGAGAVHAVDAVSLSVRENEFLTLLGPSGCGKTTLLRLIAGFEFPTEGRILLGGEDIAMLPPFRRPINTVFQSYALFPHMTVAENISFALENLKKPAAEIKATVDEMLKLVQMEALRDRRTDQISGGQQQRVALARALAPRPRVLLLDESLSALDYKLRKEMQIELKRLQGETGITFVFVTHDQEEALTMSDRIAVMKDGKVLQLGAPRDIYDRPSDKFVANFIGDTNFVTARIVGVSDGRARLKLISGREIEADLPDGFSETNAAEINVTAVVRPEHAMLTRSEDQADLTGTLRHLVYSGTDSHYHVELPDGATFIARAQNKRGQQDPLEPGTQVGIHFDPEAIQVLR